MTCALENLPSEIRIQILLGLADFPSLQSLIRASPLYLATYLEAAREKVLRELALKQLDRRLQPDALAAVRSARHYAVHCHEPQTVSGFLRDYGRARGQHEPDSEWLSCHSLTEAIDLLHLHGAIKSLCEEFCLAIASKMPQEEQSIDLSQMEQLRLYRGMYRFQTYCNFFGEDEYLSHADHLEGNEEPYPREDFLRAFPPWEVQEMACVAQYLNRRWASIFREVSDIYFPKHISRGGDDDSDLEETFDYVRLTRHESSDGNFPLNPLFRFDTGVSDWGFARGKQ